ncbi:MAG: hypothetical protein J3Q66DRAFT_345571 [Benniella sp.]|nr:MAG: hypothetical protein J3Q66DRAFT_345571 [Benniella sp.]
MEFSFTPTSSSTTPAAAALVRAQSEQVGFGQPLEALSSSQSHRTPVKKEYGIGDTAQWRKRIITQIEDRIKDKRHSIQNARRMGQQRSIDSSGPSSLTEPVQTTDGSTQDTAGISEEEERRIILEVWEAYKNENYDALAQAFHGMTDKEIEGIEQDILHYRYETDYDPTYDMVMDMEKVDMDQSIEHYMRLESCYNAIYQQDPEMANALSLSITLLSGKPCIRCRAGEFIFEPVLDEDRPVGVNSTCPGCGLCLGKDALVYIANTAQSHSESCPGQMQVAQDDEAGLLLLCPQCDLLA